MLFLSVTGFANAFPGETTKLLLSAFSLLLSQQTYVKTRCLVQMRKFVHVSLRIHQRARPTCLCCHLPATSAVPDGSWYLRSPYLRHSDVLKVRKKKIRGCFMLQQTVQRCVGNVCVCYLLSSAGFKRNNV